MVRRGAALLLAALLLSGVDYCQKDYKIGAQIRTSGSPSPSPSPSPSASPSPSPSPSPTVNTQILSENSTSQKILEGLSTLQAGTRALATNQGGMQQESARSSSQNWLGQIGGTGDTLSDDVLLALGLVADWNRNGVLDCVDSDPAGGGLTSPSSILLRDSDGDGYSDLEEFTLGSAADDSAEVPEVPSEVLCDSRLPYEEIPALLASLPSLTREVLLQQIAPIITKSLDDRPSSTWRFEEYTGRH